MIINMAVDNGASNNHALSLLNATTANPQQEQCSFNFLKRKHNAAEDICNTNQEINNQNGAGSENENLATHYQSSNEWKKRHIELSTATTLTTMTTTISANTTTATNCFDLNTNFQNSNQIDIYNNNNSNNSNMLTTNTNNNSSNNNNNSIMNNNNINSNDVTFNLITSSAFINDFFEYDAGLIVPVTVTNATSNNQQQQQQHGQLTLNASNHNNSNNNNIIHTSNLQPTNVFVDSEEWQSTDLLELDHRYNSGLQTEISQLTPTISLRSPMPSNTAINHQHQHQLQSVVTSSSQAQIDQAAASTNSPLQLQNSNTLANFLVPQKQINETQRITKYRSVQNLTQLENLQTPQKPEADSDFEDKNLSWLLNFKFDDLPHLSPEIAANNVNSNNASNSKTAAAIQNSSSNTNSSSSSQRDRSRSPKTSTTKTGKKFEELVLEVTAELDGNEMIVAENVVVEDTPLKTVKKPPFTYTELIEYALEDKGELTVSGIYQWISDRFPYYKSNDDRWKNSVRHNLSINPHFRKGVKAPQGAGHLWTISSGDSAENVLAWEHKKQRLELFFKMESMNRERLQQHQQQQQQHNEQCPSPHNHQGCQAGQCLYEEAAKAAATISQEMLQQQATTTTAHTAEGATTISNNNEQHHQRLPHAQIMHELPFNDLMSDEELRKTAGQILNGIHREVEVQSVNSIISTYHDVLLDNEDYLNPIQKDVAVHESGLRHTNSSHTAASHPAQHNSSQYYVTEIDPLELGIQMSHQVHGEEEILFNDDFNLSYFAYNAGNDIVA